MRKGVCVCGVHDWHALRTAMGLSLSEMARTLCISRSEVKRLQQHPHRCAHQLTIVALRSVLMQPEMIARLQATGFPHPFPADVP